MIVFGNRVFAETIWSGVGFKSNDWCPYEEKQMIETQREEGHMTTKAETDEMHL